MFYEFNTGLLTYLKFTSDLPNKFTEGITSNEPEQERAHNHCL